MLFCIVNLPPAYFSGTPVAGIFSFFNPLEPSASEERSRDARTTVCPAFRDINVTPPEVRVDITGIKEDLITIPRLSEETKRSSNGSFS